MIRKIVESYYFALALLLPLLSCNPQLSMEIPLLYLDKENPFILNVQAPENKSYGVGNPLIFSVLFSEAVFVKGTPYIELQVGSEIVKAEYLFGSGSSLLTFHYVARAGDWDDDGIDYFSPVHLSSGASIKDNAGNHTVLDFTTVNTLVMVKGFRPEPVISSVQTGPTNSASIPVSIAFNYRVENLTLSDLSIVNGTAVNLVGDGTNFTFDLIPTAEGIVSVVIPANEVEDDAGNGNLASNTFQIAHDSVRPFITINQVPAQVDPTRDLPIVYEVIFSEPIDQSSFDVSDITQNGSATAITWSLTPVSPTHYRLEAVAVGTNGPVVPSIQSNALNDLAGNLNIASVSTDNSVIYDTEEPELAITSPLANSYANQSNQNNFTVSGTCSEDGRNVILSGAVSGTVTCNSGIWTSTSNVSSLPQGSFTVIATHDDEAGNTIQVTRSFIKDTLPPTVAISTPTANSYVTTNSIALTGSCSENGRDVVITGGTATETASCTSASWSATVNVTGLAEGSFTLTASHTDVAGNSTQSTRDFIKNTSVPTVAITSPVNGSYINLANRAAYSVSGTCSENGRDVVVTTSPATTSTNAACTTGAWSISFNLTSVADGAVSITANHSNLAGTAATAATVNLDKDTIAPTIAFSTPADNSYVNSNSIALTGSCSEIGRDVVITGGTATETVSCTSTSWSAIVNITGVAEGSFTLTASHSDVAGNSTQSTRDFIKNTSVPTVAITSPVNGSYINLANRAAYSVSGTCSENGRDVVITTSPATTATNGTCTTGTWSLSLNLTSVADGAVSITANHSNIAGTSATAASVNLTKDTIAPTIAITSPAANSYANLGNQSSFIVSGTCSENARNVVISGAANSTVACSSGSWTTTLNLTSLGQEAFTLYADHTDLAGNPALQADRSFYKDTIAPAVTINQSSGQSDPTSSLPISFDVVFSEPIVPASFSVSDITQSGTATGVTWDLFTLDNISYILTATAITGPGTVMPTLTAGNVDDTGGNSNTSSTSTDNSVTYSLLSAPTVSMYNNDIPSSVYTNKANNIISITNDTNAVAWCVMETLSTDPAPTAPATGNACFVSTRHTSYTLLGRGVRKIYVYIKDSSNNVSAPGETTFDFPLPSTLSMTGPASIQQSGCSEAITITATDSNALPSPAPSPTVIALSGGGAGTFYSDAGCVTAIANANFAAGTSETKIWFKNHVLESLTIQATAYSSTASLATVVTPVYFITMQKEFGVSCAITSGALDCFGLDNKPDFEGDNSNLRSPVLLRRFNINSRVTSLDISRDHACIVEDGAVKCWGYNGYGQLGDGSINNSTVPLTVTGLSAGARSVATPRHAGCALIGEAVKCWGRNSYGTLGIGSTTSSSVPVDVPGLTSGVTAIAGGSYDVCAIQNGGLKCWGRNDYGQVGDGSKIQRNSPVEVPGLTSGVTAVGISERHACAIQNGSLKCWGNGHRGMLGNGSTAEQLSPVQVTGLTSGVTDLTTGERMTCAVHSGAAKCWGNNEWGQLGNGTANTSNYSTPSTVTGLSSGVARITAWKNTCVTMTNGSFKCWGPTPTGQIGTAVPDSIKVPVSAIGLSGTPVKLATGPLKSCAVMSDNRLMCWGREVGLSPTQDFFNSAPQQTSGNATDISNSEDFSCMVEGGAAKCWGNGSNGKLGYGSESSSFLPVQVSGLTSGVTAIGVSKTDRHACAVVNGGVNCWGNNDDGRLGNNSTTNSLVPVDVVGLGAGSGATKVAIGGNHSCALVTDRVYCWGDNSGRLGTGNNTDSYTPVLTVASGATDLTAGENHTCAIVNGGALCWGYNDFGQIGTGDNLIQRSPVQVVGLGSGVSKVSAGKDHSCAILTSGAVYCWGGNTHGQLGDNTVTTRLSPVNVVSLQSGATEISASYAHTCAIVNNVVKCWGEGWYNALLTNLPDSYTTPQDVIPFGAPAKLEVVGPSTSNLDTCSDPFTVVLRDAAGTGVNTAANRTITLSNGGSGNFYADAACTGSIVTSVQMNAGAGTTVFYYKASTSQEVGIVVSSPGLMRDSAVHLAEATPAVAFTPSGSTTITSSNASAYTLSGTCSGDGTVSISGALTASATCTGGNWSVTVNFSGLPDGNHTLNFNFTSNFGSSAPQTSYTFIKNTFVPLVEPFYANGVNWNDYVRSNGIACDGTESSYSSCIHGGEKKKVVLTGYSSCSGVIAADQLNVFYWACDDSSGTATVYSVGLKSKKGLKDLVNATSFKANKVIVSGSVSVETASTTWWSNTVQALTSNSNSTDAPIALNGVGVIYTLDTSRATSGYNLNADKQSIVTLPGVVLSYSNRTNTCKESDGELNATLNMRCLLSAGSQKFLWIETEINGSGAEHGVLIVNTIHSRITRSRFYGSISTGIYLATGSNKNIINQIGASGAGCGICFWDNQRNRLDEIVVANNYDGIEIEQSSQNVFTRISTINSTRSGIYFTGTNSQQNVFSQIVVSASNTGATVNTSNSTMSFMSFMGNSTAINLPSGTGLNTLNQVLLWNTWRGLVVQTPSNTISQLVSSYADEGVVIQQSGSSSKFTGYLIVGDNAVKDCLTVGTGHSIVDTTCTNTGSDGSSTYLDSNSNAVLRTGRILSGSFIEGVTGDSENTSDTNGTATYSSSATFDWTRYDNMFRAWTKPSLDGLWTSGTGQIFDWSFRVSDTVLKDKSGDASTFNELYTVGSNCPSAVHGNKAVTDLKSTPNTYLLNAMEIFDDGIGDEDGLCESGEACIYAPNFGADQGTGNYKNNQCAFQNGLVQNVSMYAYDSEVL